MNELLLELLKRIFSSIHKHEEWCCVMLVCKKWKQICADLDWKTSEFAQYRLAYKNSTIHYGSFLPNGIEHGLSYRYYHDSEIINEMRLWKYGKNILNVDYDYYTTKFSNLSYRIKDPNYSTDCITIMIMHICGCYIVKILSNEGYKEFEFNDI